MLAGCQEGAADGGIVETLGQDLQSAVSDLDDESAAEIMTLPCISDSVSLCDLPARCDARPPKTLTNMVNIGAMFGNIHMIW